MAKNMIKMKSKLKNNNGRSMLEMLGVLAVIGVLSIGALIGFKMSINKHAANNILQDASLTLAEIAMMEPTSSTWKQITFTPSSAHDFYGMRTTSGTDLVKVVGVKKDVCEILLDYKTGTDISGIYSDEAATTELTECSDNQLMVFAYGSVGSTSEESSEKTCPTGTIKMADGSCSEACESGQTPYCYGYNSDGTCDGASCASGTCTPAKFDKKGVCCTSSQTPYCRTYNADGTCYMASCASGTCTPAKVDRLGVCCTSSQTPYCRFYFNSDRTCSQTGCVSGTCTPYRKSTGNNGRIYYGDCCDESTNTLTKIDNIAACCSSSQTPYCRSYNSDGTCAGASCASGTCTPAKFDRLGICCSSSQTPYCYSYKSDGTCEYAYCASSTCTPAKFDRLGICCSSSQTPYCGSYNSDGTCEFAHCASGTCTPYRKTSGNNGGIYYGNCCDESTKTLTKIDNIAACCSSSQTPYCGSYNTDGTCDGASCASGTCTPAKFDTVGVCCTSSQTPYCRTYNSDGTCSWAYCASGTCTPYRKTSGNNGGCCSGTLSEKDANGYQTCS